MKMRPLIGGTALALGCVLASQAVWAQSELRSRHFTTSDGVELHYLEAGSGATLVFVPGWTMPAWIWEPQLEHFAASHRVVALDPRGQGESEKPAHGYHAERRAQDICELLEHLGGETAVVAGWSLAVQEVLVCAQQSGAEHIQGVVLVDHPIDMDPEAAREIAAQRVRSLQLDRPSWTRMFIEAIHHSQQPEEYLAALTEAALSVPTNAAAIMVANIHFLGPTDLGPALDSLDRPVLFVASSQDWAVAAADVVREGWPDVRVEILEDTDHALFVDKPERFNRVLEEFLAGLPEPSDRRYGSRTTDGGSDEVGNDLKRAPVRGGELEYEVQGEGEPVLLIHGSHVAAAFRPFLTEPSLADYRLLRYHRRGLAGSTGHDGAFSVPEQAADALALLRHLGVGRAHVVGHSYGAVTALQLALDAPDVVHSLVLLEPPLLMVPSAEAIGEALAPAIERYHSGDPAGAVEAFMGLIGGPGWTTHVDRAVPGGAEQARRDAATYFEVELPALERWEFDAERAGRISQPTLYALGGESGPFAEEGAELARSWLSQVQELLVPGTNHLLPLQEPRFVAEGIAAFLGRHPLR